MLRNETREIDGLTFTTTQFVSLRALELLPRLMKIGMPLLTMAMRSKGAALGPMQLMAGLGSTSPEEVVDLAVAMLANTQFKDGKVVRALTDRDKINATFEGKILTLLRVVVFAAEVNYSDFFAVTSKSADAAPVAQSSEEKQ
jgi:hypothetical protein